MKNLLITAAVLSLLFVLTGAVKSTDPYAVAGEVLGGITIALLNAHLTGKYLSWDVVKKYPLPTMLIVGVASLLFVNSVLVFLVIVGSIMLNKLTRITNPKVKK